MTLLNTGQWKIRDLVMGPGTQYRVVDSSSPFALSVRDDQSRNRPHAHGGLVGSEWANPRVVPIRVMIDADQYDELGWLDALDPLTSAFRPVGDTGEIVEMYRNISGREYVWFGRTRMIEPSTDLAAGGYGFVQLAFEAADPRRYAAGLSSQSTGLAIQQGGMTVPAGVATTRLRLPAVSGAYPSTPSHASLNITGDLDLRVDADLKAWSSPQQSLISKYDTTANLRAYRLRVNSAGTLALQVSPDGTSASVVTFNSSATVPISSGRIAIRATLDVDNGAAGKTAVFYTAPTIAGPWTQLGSTQTIAGTTSIFVSTAPLEVGSVTVGTLDLARGVVYAAEVRSGIGGTVVATPDFTAQTRGAASFADSTGKTWTVNGTAELVGDTYRRGLTVPFTIPGSLNGGYIDLVNTGTADSGLVVRIDGPAVQPRLILHRPDGTVQQISFDLDLLAGQWLDIDTTAHLALLNGLPESNQRGRAVWGMDAYPIQPGTNRLRFLSAVYNGSASLTTQHRSAWW